MKRAGEPLLEHDFPPGSDMISQILSQPKAAERMEFELFGRLSAYTWEHVVFLKFNIVRARWAELTTCIMRQECWHQAATAVNMSFMSYGSLSYGHPPFQ